MELNSFTLGIFPPKKMTSSVQGGFHKPGTVLSFTNDSYL